MSLTREPLYALSPFLPSIPAGCASLSCVSPAPSLKQPLLRGAWFLLLGVVLGNQPLGAESARSSWGETAGCFQALSGRAWKHLCARTQEWPRLFVCFCLSSIYVPSIIYHLAIICHLFICHLSSVDYHPCIYLSPVYNLSFIYHLSAPVLHLASIIRHLSSVIYHLSVIYCLSSVPPSAISVSIIKPQIHNDTSNSRPPTQDPALPSPFRDLQLRSLEMWVSPVAALYESLPLHIFSSTWSVFRGAGDSF